MVKQVTRIGLVAVLLFLSIGLVAAQAEERPSSNMGEDVLSHNFVMQGLPGDTSIEESSNAEEIEFERSFEREASENEGFEINQEQALENALEELGSSEWQLVESERSSGLYEFSFERDESEAEVSVDGFTGEVVELDAEIEWEPGNREPSVSLTGFIQFSRLGYEVDSDTDVNEDERTVTFELEIEQDEVSESESLNRQPVREVEDVEPGRYNAVVEVVRDDEVVYTENDQIVVPGDSETEEEEESREQESLEEASREELIEEIKSLREQVRDLQNRIDSNRPETDVEQDRDEATEEVEEVEDVEEATEGSESEEVETPGRSDSRPGFVNNLLSGIFG